MMLMPELNEQKVLGQIRYFMGTDKRRTVLDSKADEVENISRRGGTGFEDNDESNSYKLCGYRNVLTMESYSKEELQREIGMDKRVGTVDVMEANIEAMERDLAEILRLNGEQKRLWQVYEEWKRR